MYSFKNLTSVIYKNKRHLVVSIKKKKINTNCKYPSTDEKNKLQ